MRTSLLATSLMLSLSATFSHLAAAEGPRTETWDYTPTIVSISKHFTGDVGKVVPMGDSITYANQASKWPRSGAGKTPEDKAICQWMKANANDQSNGWWLASNDQPKNRSWTASSGITSGEYIAGGHHSLPSLKDLLSTHKPQIALILLGSNDVKGGVSADVYLANMTAIYQACMNAGAVPVVTTIPPTTAATPAAIAAYNDGLYAIAEKLKLPFLDLHGEFMRYAPGDTWKSTLISKDGIHPTYEGSEGPATEENLKKCGYLVKSVMQCRKVAAIKAAMKW